MLCLNFCFECLLYKFSWDLSDSGEFEEFYVLIVENLKGSMWEGSVSWSLL